MPTLNAASLRMWPTCSDPVKRTTQRGSRWNYGFDCNKQSRNDHCFSSRVLPSNEIGSWHAPPRRLQQGAFLDVRCAIWLSPLVTIYLSSEFLKSGYVKVTVPFRFPSFVSAYCHPGDSTHGDIDLLISSCLQYHRRQDLALNCRKY